MQDGNVDAFQSQVGAVAIEAREVRERISGVVIAEADVAVSPSVAADARRRLAEPIAFEAAARDDVEYAIAAIAEVGRQAATRRFERRDVLRIESRPAGRQVAVRHGDAVDLPADA